MEKDKLAHVMMLDNVEHSIGTHKMVDVVLFNSEKISAGDAFKVVASLGYSPYVLSIPKDQYEKMFLNKE